MVASGMHKAMVPYAVTTMGNLGKEALYLPASLAHNIAESGACFAIALALCKEPRSTWKRLIVPISASFAGSKMPK